MKLAVHADRVVVSGFDVMSAFVVLFGGSLVFPAVVCTVLRWLGLGGELTYFHAWAVVPVAALCCRYRFVADARGCRLGRALAFIPWSIRSFGHRARVSVEIDWEADDLVITPEHPEDECDCLSLLHPTMGAEGAWHPPAMEAWAALVDREIERVVGLCPATAEGNGGPYRSPPRKGPF
ncbi:hypothetical protein [Chondromyces crocatus]|uniref:Uncharacterized protein n=1 Tax=Chondromyces crocatus TaxID=52 RepID=A0A0K1EBU3_CHOCO|nr:hypothetical protein [Chondromyces crocatus]AKT38356.1 uncharacterized protein CMC5_025020 [Chondromyces crocatus]